MVTFVFCKPIAKDTHGFYLKVNGKEYFLFSQNYRRSVKDYFGYGVMLRNALDHTRAKGNSAILRTMEKLPSHIQYIEREYGIAILRQTVKKNARHGKRAA